MEQSNPFTFFATFRCSRLLRLKPLACYGNALAFAIRQKNKAFAEFVRWKRKSLYSQDPMAVTKSGAVGAWTPCVRQIIATYLEYIGA